MSYISADVIGIAGFGYQFNAVQTNGENDKLIEATRTWFRIQPLFRLFPKMMWLKFKFGVFKTIRETSDYFKNTVHSLIEARKKEPAKHQDILSLLMAAASEDSSEKPLTDRELMANCRLFLIAGLLCTTCRIAYCVVK